MAFAYPFPIPEAPVLAALPLAALPNAATVLPFESGYGILVALMTEVRVCVWKTVWVVEVLLAVSVLLGRIPVTESPSTRLLESPVYMPLEVLELGKLGESGVVNAAALGLGDVTEEDSATEDDGWGIELCGVKRVEQVDVVAGGGDVVAEEESVTIPEGTTADEEVGTGG